MEFLWVFEGNYWLGNQDHFCLLPPDCFSPQMQVRVASHCSVGQAAEKSGLALKKFPLFNLSWGCLHTPVLMRKRGCDSSEAVPPVHRCGLRGLQVMCVVCVPWPAVPRSRRKVVVLLLPQCCSPLTFSAPSLSFPLTFLGCKERV